jgi:hypothetical protein
VKAAALTAFLAATAAGAFCPSYTLSSTNNNNNCGVEAAAGTNPTPTQWQAIFAIVSGGPSQWGTNGPAVANIGQGCGKPMPSMSVPARFPCELLKAIAMQESSWKQFCVPDSPSDQVGGVSRTIIAFDCGYGIGQVTSGMHTGESPAFDRARVASDPTYNLATGTQILAGKWKATNCVGDNQPSIIEDWYTATWAYNGLAYSNNPSNPAYSSTRGVYNPSVGGSAPYQERVFGWMEHPPTPSHWAVTAIAYPNPSQVGGSGAPPALPEPSCASPTNCAGTRSVHVSSCFATDAGTPADAGVFVDAGVKPDAGTTADAGMTSDAGVADAGEASDAGTNPVDAGRLLPDGGPLLPVASWYVNEELGPAAPVGCGCGTSVGAPLLGLAVLLLARRKKGTGYFSGSALRDPRNGY